MLPPRRLRRAPRVRAVPRASLVRAGGAGRGRVRESACAEPGGSLLPRGGVSRCGVDLLPVAGLHLTQACDSASLARFMALAISVAGVQGREALHSACVCACTRACACVRDNPCFPPGMRMCGCDECVIREDTLGWSVVGTLERRGVGSGLHNGVGGGGGDPRRGGWPGPVPAQSPLSCGRSRNEALGLWTSARSDYFQIGLSPLKVQFQD